MTVGLNPGPVLRSMEIWDSSSAPGDASESNGCHTPQARVRVVEWVEEGCVCGWGTHGTGNRTKLLPRLPQARKASK